MKIILTIFAISVTCILAKDVEQLTSIYGMQGLKIICDTKAKLELIRPYVIKPGFDFTRLTTDVNVPVEVLVSADQLKNFKNLLDSNLVNYEVLIDDVSEAIKENINDPRNRRSKRINANDIFDSFPRYDEIILYLKSIAKAHSDRVEYTSIGRSYEGRDIGAVKISSGPGAKAAILVDAGIHAREWIAPVTALYTIKLLAESTPATRALHNVDVYVIPLLNPDGYEFSHRSNETRLWRKTRSRNQNSRCFGVDGNRNFEHKWGVVGASSSPCSEVYAGSKSFSEPETTALRDFILSHKNIRVYVSLHSALNAILYPWGYTKMPSSSEKELKCTGQKAAAALAKVRGTRYTVGNSANSLYPAAGGSDDWALAQTGVKLAYTIELPSESFGFFAPTSEIQPIGRETFEAIRVLAKYAEVGNCQKL